MQKKVTLLALFTLILVSCDFQPSQFNSFISSLNQSTSNPSSFSSNSSTSSLSSSNNGSSSAISSSQTSSSSSQEEDEETDRKVSFDDIDTLVAQVADAQALGIENSKDDGSTSTPSGRKASQTPADQNYVVKVTETYDPSAQITEDQTVKVTFLRTTNTVTNELQTGYDTLIATAAPIELEKTINVPGHVVIKNVPQYEFRARQGDVVLEDWKVDVGTTTEFLFKQAVEGSINEVAEAPSIEVELIANINGLIEVKQVVNYEFRLLSDNTILSEWTRSVDGGNILFNYDQTLYSEVTVEARSFNATVTFTSIEGLAYSVKQEDETIVSSLVDNAIGDLSAIDNEISIGGLTQGLTYIIDYQGLVRDTSLTDIEIDARSIDASISFTAFNEFTYEIKQGDTLLYTNLVDNNIIDLNPVAGVIEVKGLIQDQSYQIHYSGYKLIERVTQDEIDGQVDKLFVLNQYTFISFVPLTMNPRPQDANLVRDYDRVPVYDKTNYFSNSTRQSFVIDNDSGYIYKIEDTVINNLSGGCVSIQGNPSPFDIKTNTNGSLSFVSLSNNSSVVVNGCVKDKYGYTYVNNNLINEYVPSTKTYFYVTNSFYSTFYDVPFNNAPSTGLAFTYWLTSSGEVVRTEPTGLPNGGLMYQVMSGEAVNATRSINENDNFEIYVSQFKYRSVYGSVTHQQTSMQHLVPVSRVKDGVVYTNFGPNVSGKPNPLMFYPTYGYFNQFNYLVKTENDVTTYYSSYIDPNFGQQQALPYYSMIDYLDEYGLVVIQRNAKVFYYQQYWPNHLASFSTSNANNVTTYSPNVNGSTIYGKHTTAHVGQATELTALAGATINSQGKLQRVTSSATLTYDLIAEFKDERWVITPYVTGTYQAAPATTITFQPINK
jgi:hypothetical protein